jgi:hypothetical protein
MCDHADPGDCLFEFCPEYGPEWQDCPAVNDNPDSQLRPRERLPFDDTPF